MPVLIARISRIVSHDAWNPDRSAAVQLRRGGAARVAMPRILGRPTFEGAPRDRMRPAAMERGRARRMFASAPLAPLWSARPDERNNTVDGLRAVVLRRNERDPDSPAAGVRAVRFPREVAPGKHRY